MASESKTLNYETMQESKEKYTVDNTQGLKPEFLEHPKDAYVTKNPAIVKCSARNVKTLYIECNNRVIDAQNFTSVRTFRKYHR